MRAVIRLMPIVFMALAPGLCAAGPTPKEILHKALDAESALQAGLSLDGRMHTETRIGDRLVEADLRIERRAGETRTQFVSGEVAGMIVVDDGRYIVRGLLERPALRAQRPPGPRIDLHELLLRNYHVRLLNPDRRGREPYEIQLARRAGKGPSTRFWVEPEHFVIVKQEHYRSDGALASRTEYTTGPRFGRASRERRWTIPLPEKITDAKAPSAEPASLAELSKTVGFKVTEPADVGAFRLVGMRVFRCRCGVASAHLRYSDGLASFSVFERLAKCDRCGKEAGGGKGWQHRHGRGGGRGAGQGQGDGPVCELLEAEGGAVVSTVVGDKMYIVVGDLPKAELERIADSFVP